MSVREYEFYELQQVDEVGTLIENPGPLVPGKYVTYHLNHKCHGIVISVVDNSASVLWSTLEDPSLSKFGNFVAPLIRRVYPTAIAAQIISVQPMSLPSASIFYADYTYNQDKKKSNGKRKSSKSNPGSKRTRTKKG